MSLSVKPETLADVVELVFASSTIPCVRSTSLILTMESVGLAQTLGEPSVAVKLNDQLPVPSGQRLIVLPVAGAPTTAPGSLPKLTRSASVPSGATRAALSPPLPMPKSLLPGRLLPLLSRKMSWLRKVLVAAAPTP